MTIDTGAAAGLAATGPGNASTSVAGGEGVFGGQGGIVVSGFDVPTSVGDTSYDPEAEEAVEVLVRIGRSVLTVRHEYPRGSRDRGAVLDQLTRVAAAYDFERGDLAGETTLE